ncbi:MAG: Sec-independent protein translocase protein TatB [Acidithiobacillus sp.]|nr:Sec-independent protein translocase protein TatB [Acidithiobacillus sp.]
MFDFSFGELALLAVIALLVVGPEKLPGLARSAGRWYGYLRRTAQNVRSEVEQQLLLEEMRKEASQLKDLATEPLQEAKKLQEDLNEVLLPESPKSSDGTEAETLPKAADPTIKTPLPPLEGVGETSLTSGTKTPTLH